MLTFINDNGTVPMDDSAFYQIAKQNKTFHFNLAKEPHPENPDFMAGVKLDFVLYDENGRKTNPNQDSEFMDLARTLRSELEKRGLMVTDHGMFDFYSDRGHYHETYNDKEFCSHNGLLEIMQPFDSPHAEEYKEKLFAIFNDALEAIGAERVRKHVLKHIVEQPENRMERALDKILEPHIFQTDIRSRVITQIVSEMERAIPPQRPMPGFSVN